MCFLCGSVGVEKNVYHSVRNELKISGFRSCSCKISYPENGVLSHQSATGKTAT